MRDQQILLVLDNFEQVLAAALALVELLTACPRLKLLVTSREVLRLSGEYEFPVPPLPVPDPRHLPPAVTLSQYAAVALFLQRALAVKPDFAITHENALAVAEICVRLDGLPLAIELAAARMKLFSPRALLVRLARRLEWLNMGARDAPRAIRRSGTPSRGATIFWKCTSRHASGTGGVCRWLYLRGCGHGMPGSARSYSRLRSRWRVRQ